MSGAVDAQALLDQLKPGGLPILRRTHELLTQLSPRRENITAREVANEVLADPLATFQAMHAINERLGQRGGTEVTALEHALMMQGLGVYLDAAVQLPILEDTAVGRDARVLAAFYGLVRRAQHAAWQARDFAVLHADVRAEEVQVAALLHHAPECLLWLRAPDRMRQLRRLSRTLPAQEAETQVLGMPLPALGLEVLTAWSIPDLTLDLLNGKYPERSRQQILTACLDIARLSERGWWNEALLEPYVALAGVENTPLDLVVATAHMNAARVARAGNWLPVPAAATWGPMLPGDWPEEADEEEEKQAPEEAEKTAAPEAPREPAPASVPPATPQPAPQTPPPAIQAVAATGAKSAPSSVSPPPPAPAAVPPAPEAPHSICPMPDKLVFRETLKGIEGHLDGSLTLNQMSAIILKGLHTGLGLSRILFAMVTPDGGRVKSRFTLGIPSGDPLRQFEFELGNKDLFTQLMGKMQGVWVNEGNRDKLWPMVSPAMQKIVGSGDFYAMSLFSGSKPLGLIYADRGHGDCGLDPHTYTDFKMLCLQAARGLAKVRG